MNRRRKQADQKSNNFITLKQRLDISQKEKRKKKHRLMNFIEG